MHGVAPQVTTTTPHSGKTIVDVNKLRPMSRCAAILDFSPWSAQRLCCAHVGRLPVLHHLGCHVWQHGRAATFAPEVMLHHALQLWRQYLRRHRHGVRDPKVLLHSVSHCHRTCHVTLLYYASSCTPQCHGSSFTTQITYHAGRRRRHRRYRSLQTQSMARRRMRSGLGAESCLL